LRGLDDGFAVTLAAGATSIASGTASLNGNLDLDAANCGPTKRSRVNANGRK
jgi:hypothetical protein